MSFSYVLFNQNNGGKNPHMLCIHKRARKFHTDGKTETGIERLRMLNVIDSKQKRAPTLIAYLLHISKPKHNEI